jgi:hypothetical protein
VLPEPCLADQNEQAMATARLLLSQAYLGGMKFADVLKLLKQADREVMEGRPPKEES